MTIRQFRRLSRARRRQIIDDIEDPLTQRVLRCAFLGPGKRSWVQVALIIGGGVLIAVGTIKATIPVTYLATVAVISLLTGHDPLVQLLSGGLLLGAFFMATDYTTSPYTTKGQIVYGLLLGVITCGIRFWGNMAEGVSYAILIMNLLVPYINALTRHRPLGVGGGKK